MLQPSATRYMYLLKIQQLLFRQMKWPEEGGHKVTLEGTAVLAGNLHLSLLNPTRDSPGKVKNVRGWLHIVSSDTKWS